jgi:hypothetical protein
MWLDERGRGLTRSTSRDDVNTLHEDDPVKNATQHTSARLSQAVPTKEIGKTHSSTGDSPLLEGNGNGGGNWTEKGSRRDEDGSEGREGEEHLDWERQGWKVKRVTRVGLKVKWSRRRLARLLRWL